MIPEDVGVDKMLLIKSDTLPVAMSEAQSRQPVVVTAQHEAGTATGISPVLFSVE